MRFFGAVSIPNGKFSHHFRNAREIGSRGGGDYSSNPGSGA